MRESDALLHAQIGGLLSRARRSELDAADDPPVTLGRLIEALEEFDDDQLFPFGMTTPHSYRGHYEELAFVPCGWMEAHEILAAARSAVGATYQGWKGGDFTMTLETPVHLSRIGDTGLPLTEYVLRWLLGMMDA